jgi:hypothetical protein
VIQEDEWDGCAPGSSRPADEIIAQHMPRLLTSVYGTFETFRDVRSLVAIGGKADIDQAAPIKLGL